MTNHVKWFHPFRDGLGLRALRTDKACGFLEQKKKASAVGAHTLCRGIVARCDSMSEAGEAHVWCGSSSLFFEITMIGVYSSMNYFPMVFIIGFAEVLSGKPPILAIVLFLDGDHAKTRDNPRPFGKNSSGSRHDWPFRFIWMAIAPKFATIHDRWEKCLGKPPIMAIALFLARHSAKTRDHPAVGLGKSFAKTANHGQFALLDRELAKTSDNPRPTGKNAWGNRLSWPSPSNAAIELVNHRGSRKWRRESGVRPGGMPLQGPRRGSAHRRPPSFPDVPRKGTLFIDRSKESSRSDRSLTVLGCGRLTWIRGVGQIL